MTTKTERITAKVNQSKEGKRLEKESFYNLNDFMRDAKDYIKAIKERRMIVSIPSVSASGMSRHLLFTSCEKDKKSYYYRNYRAFFRVLGYSFGRDRLEDSIKVNGCGMDMVFSTNYNNIKRLYSLGFISKEECATLAQRTPAVI